MSGFFAEAFNEIYRQCSRNLQIPEEHRMRQMELEALKQWFNKTNASTARLRCRSIRTKRQ